jgi:UDP:flavonoid glycosyltransferase YjiC (YdhE family)
LIGAAGTDFTDVPAFEHVMVVGTMYYATVFPACRAVVHHGGSSTTPIGMRAGVPQLILYWDMVHAVYGAAVKRLKVGTARRFSTATEDSLVADLRTILAPDYVARARDLATRITAPAQSAAAAADRLEDFARLRRAG